MFILPTSHFGKSNTLNKANFPCLIEGFIDTGISGNNLTGVLGTVVVESSTGWTLPSADQFRRAASGTVTTSGTWEAIGSRHALLMQMGSFATAAANTTLGDASYPQMIVRGTSGGDLSHDVDNNASFAAVSGATYPVQAEATLLDQSTANGAGRRYVVDDGVNLAVVNATVFGDISQSWSAFTVGAGGAAFMNQASSYYTGVFLLALSELPTDAFIFTALNWQIANPKKLYPGFYHRS